MSRESEKLYHGITNIDVETIEKAQIKRNRRTRYRWAGPVAAVLALAILVGVLSNRGGLTAYAIAEASYPKQSARVNSSAYAGALDGFLTASIPQFLSGAGEGNRVYSPLNVYMALSMLAELTDGNTRAQILDLLGAEDVETQRERANAVWNLNYLNDDTGKRVLASSLWLNQDVNFVKSTMDTLAKDYFASSYRGEMGSEAFDAALQSWLNAQTDGMLEEQAGKQALDKRTVMALATTVYFRAKWYSGFNESATSPSVFHAPGGDMIRDFMRKEQMESAFFWGKKFSAVLQGFTINGKMWYILPDEDVSPDELLSDAEFLEFLAQDNDHFWTWENHKRLLVNLSVPKFDVVSELDLLPGLAALGVTDALDWTVSDFSPMTADTDVYVSEAAHAARVAIDEEGCVAAAFTVISAPTAGEPPGEVIDFVLDRPFLFAITGADGLPLFVGVVNQP